jgi:DNA-binding MarR family transcriptional regulator
LDQEEGVPALLPDSTMPTRKTNPSAAPSACGRQSPVRSPIDQSAMQGLVGYNIRRAELHMRQAFDRSVGKSGLRPSEFSILVLIDSNALVTQTALGLALNIRRPNMVVLIEGLERRGVVVRAVHEHDRRMQTLRLTVKGKTLLRDAHRRSREGELEAYACWSDRERAQVVALLRRLYEQK